MSRSPTADPTDQDHLVSLVFQSKKALQQGEVLCSRANALSTSSAQDAFDVLALHSKLKWISKTVAEQLKLAANVAKNIEQRRLKLEKQAQEWDMVRSQQASTLDVILESLGDKLVPPSFHETETDSSLFGSQSSDSEDGRHTAPSPTRSPTLTIRSTNGKLGHKELKTAARRDDRSRWKTLRDFADEGAIEGAFESMDRERNDLDEILAVTASYAHNLTDTLDGIKHDLPSLTLPVNIEQVLTSQERVSEFMASQLESLATHYEQMEQALAESEAGGVFEEDDLLEMNRDIEELPVIIGELEDAYTNIEISHEELLAAKQTLREGLSKQRIIIDELDELGEIMEDMLQRQQDIETDFEDRLSVLTGHLSTIEGLVHHFTSYQESFSRLLLEMARRLQYKEAMDHIVQGMISQLESATAEEYQVRADFYSQHGPFLPIDLCFGLENPPTRYTVVPLDGDVMETIPDIPNDILANPLVKIA
ncbi:autophagy protein Apg17-domain-containing protein [Amylostereum chailletii]|nr:autophagy protein Apg17-domain-containing protein [Amylostereum chailletii]